MQPVQIGLDRLEQETWQELNHARLGLLSNAASLSSRLVSAAEVVANRFPGQLRALFAPQHGYEGADQDNMVESPHGRHEHLEIPIYSLYAESRKPAARMLDLLDVLLIDLQDVGARVYTFAATMLNCMKAAALQGKKVVVLDRPNPLGGEVVEGNMLRHGFTSFVGPYAMPMRHGLTLGEISKIFNDTLQLGCDLEVITMNGWRRSMMWHETGRKWTMPSPNMPFPDTSWVYPGQVVWEGTNISEGRGTCRPFEMFGAPFLDPRGVSTFIADKPLPGCVIQEYSFRPTFHKWHQDLCRGFFIHVTDPHRYRPCWTSLLLMEAVIQIHGEQFQWREPPYEYELERQPIDVIMGDPSFRHDLESGVPATSIAEKWGAHCEWFKSWRAVHLIYS